MSDRIFLALLVFVAIIRYFFLVLSDDLQILRFLRAYTGEGLAWSLLLWMLYFSRVSLENTICGQICSTKQNCQLKVKFGTQTNSNMQNSMMVFTFFCVRPEISYLGKFSQKKIKIVNLSLNLVPRQILICRIKWWCFLSLFLTGDTLLGKFGSKTQNLFLKWNFITRLIPMSRIQCWCYFILF